MNLHYEGRRGGENYRGLGLSKEIEDTAVSDEDTTGCTLTGPVVCFEREACIGFTPSLQKREAKSVR